MMLFNYETILLYLNLFVICTGREHHPGYEYYPDIHGWVKLHEEPADWQAARLYCHDEDALLASPWSPEITSVINTLQSYDKLMGSLHSGFRKVLAEGTYKYVNGEPVMSMNPSDFENLERCMVFLADGSTGEVSCKQQLPFVCFAAAPLCGDKSLNYEFSSKSKSCYKFHGEVENWPDAYKVCKQEGAHLAVINSQEEAEVLVELFTKYLSQNITNGHHIYNAAVGVYYSKPSKTWKTIQSQTLEESGFKKWKLGDPNGAGDAGSLTVDGQLDDNPRSLKIPFICEMEPCSPTHSPFGPLCPDHPLPKAVISRRPVYFSPGW